MPHAWMIRAGQGAVFVEAFIEKKHAAIDFYSRELGSVDASLSRDEIAERIAAHHPSMKARKVLSAASQLYRFIHDIKKGDKIVTGDPSRRRYFLGSVTSDARYEGDQYARSVDWTHRAPRDVLTVESRNSLGAIQTLFRLSEEVVADLEAHAVPIGSAESVEAPTAPAPQPEAPSLQELMNEAAEKAQEFIEDLIAKLDPYEMQELVAGILRAMGYKTRTAGPGADRGVDIFASPDGLGLEEPRIFVEVKHRSAQMRSDELRAFLGGRRPGDRCLYVSTGGFSKDARYEAERSSVPLTLIDLPALRELMLEHYEKLDTETRQLVPLRHLYWPLGDE